MSASGISTTSIGRWAGFSPTEGTARKEVTCLYVAGPRGNPHGTPSHRAVWPQCLRHPVLLLGCPASHPLPGLRAALLRNLSLQMSQGSGEWHCTRPSLVRIAQPFHLTGVWLLRCELGSLAGLLVPWGPLVRWAPPDLDGDARHLGFPASDFHSWKITRSESADCVEFHLVIASHGHCVTSALGVTPIIYHLHSLEQSRPSFLAQNLEHH